MPDRAERENPRAERRPHSEKRAALERGRQGTEADDSGSGKGAELTIGSANRNDEWFQMAEAGEKSWKWVHSFFPTSSGCATMLRKMLMYGREAQSKTRIASPATIPKSGERNRKIHSCMLYLISI